MTNDRDRTPWTPERVARLGFLVGQGWDARRIAEDPAIAATIGNVHRTTKRFGLSFGAAAAWRLPADVAARLDDVAGRRQLSREGVIRAVLVKAGARPNLLDNILDGPPT